MTPAIIVVMGVSGAGKTTVGQAVADALGWNFQDADALHPQANIVKMAAGHPLDDADRAPWLDLLAGWVRGRIAAGQPGVLGCSLLRRRYRDQVIGGAAQVRLVFLTAPAAVLRARMGHRTGHFMAPHMLDSQLATLEPPGEAEQALQVDVTGSLDEIVRGIMVAVGAKPAAPPPDPAYQIRTR